MNGAEGLTGNCKDCGTALEHALVRESATTRRPVSSRSPAAAVSGSSAIQVETTVDALRKEDVAVAALQLAAAQSLSDLFAPGDLDLPDAA